MTNLSLIKRTAGLLTQTANLEHLVTFPRFPVYMGCTDAPIDTDLFSEMTWDICPDTGMIQLQKLLPLSVLYQFQHNEGIGTVWSAHYDQFCQFVARQSPTHVLEIGGAHGIIAKQYVAENQSTKWTIVEPNPTFDGDDQISVIPKWFDDQFQFDGPVDTVVHSHVTEHTYDPAAFFRHIYSFLKVKDRHVFSIPNMKEQLVRRYTNCLNFEHTLFLTEEIIDSILRNTGFRIIEKRYFLDHSIFYATEKMEVPAPLPFLNSYQCNRYLFQTFLDYHHQLIADINAQLKTVTGPVYLFGAHIFSQYLMAFGLNTDGVVCVLDNGPQKQGKRLYGTPFTVASPRLLAGIDGPTVILKAGIYNDEIKRDVLETINPSVTFIE